MASFRRLPGVWLRRWSPIYLTEPVGFSSPHWFFNLVAEIETSLSPWALLFVLRGLECLAGRKRTGEVTDRPLDLDLLLYQDAVFSSPVLTLPHPRLHERLFVLRPLTDLLAQGKHPLMGQTYQELLSSLPARERVEFLVFAEP